jgi:hypothetical protein
MTSENMDMMLREAVRTRETPQFIAMSATNVEHTVMAKFHLAKDVCTARFVLAAPPTTGIHAKHSPEWECAT